MAHIAIDARIISSTTGRYVERLLHHLEMIDQTNTYTVLVRKKDEHYWKSTNPNFSIKVADFANYSFAEQTGFLTLLNRLKADLVHFCMPEQPILYQGKKITTIHDLTLLKTYNPDKNWLTYHFKQFVGQFVFRIVSKTSRFTITPTKYVKNDVITTLKAPQDRVVQIYEAAEAVTSAVQEYSLPSPEFILFVGQQSEYKNVLRLAEAHQVLLKNRPNLQLVLVGKIDSAARRTQKIISDRSYKNIVFTGFVSDAELNWLYQNTRAFIFPSLSEGFGLPGLEAMIQGAPVLASNSTCLPEVYEGAAYYFDPLDSTAIAEAIEKVLSDKGIRDTLIKNGHKQAAKYSWKKMAKQTLDLYNQSLL